jgi:hypothetical protein
MIDSSRIWTNRKFYVDRVGAKELSLNALEPIMNEAFPEKSSKGREKKWGPARRLGYGTVIPIMSLQQCTHARLGNSTRSYVQLEIIACVPSLFSAAPGMHHLTELS